MQLLQLCKSVVFFVTQVVGMGEFFLGGDVVAGQGGLFFVADGSTMMTQTDLFFQNFGSLFFLRQSCTTVE